VSHCATMLIHDLRAKHVLQVNLCNWPVLKNEAAKVSHPK
jgi:hypothetical protein